MTVGHNPGMNDAQGLALRALAAELSSDNRPLPCTVLGRLVRGQVAVDESAVALKAVLLAAVQHRFAVLLLGSADPSTPWDAPQVRGWDQSTAPKRKSLAAELLEVRAPVLGREALACQGVVMKDVIQARQFLQQLPIALLTDMLRWAPPVVWGPNEDGRYWVVENALVGVIARLAIPAQRVAVRLLERRSESPYSQLDLARSARAILGPIAENFEHLTIRASPNLKIAQLLSGRKRSWCAQVRSRQGVLSA
jgi:hypothetical protein